jgi:hypothetical protein
MWLPVKNLKCHDMAEEGWSQVTRGSQDPTADELMRPLAGVERREG